MGYRFIFIFDLNKQTDDTPNYDNGPKLQFRI